MRDIGVGEDNLALVAGQQSLANGRISLDVLSQGHIVDERQVFLGVDFINRLQTAQGGAVLEEKFAPQVGCFFGWQAEFCLDVQVDPAANGLPQAAAGWIQGIVQVDEEGGDFHWQKYT